MEAALAQGLVGANTLPPLSSQEAMASDDRHPLILLVSAVFWVFRMFRIQLTCLWNAKLGLLVQCGYCHGRKLL